MTDETEYNKARIKSIFNTIASGYDNPSQRYFPFAADYLITLAKPRSGDRVLDVATGTGLVAIAAAQAIHPGGRVQAIDISTNMLDKAEANISKHALQNIDLHEMDAENLEFRSNYFDLITCSFGVFFFDNPAKAVKQWLRVLKPSGRIVFSSFAQNAFEPVMTLFREDIQSMGLNLPETKWQQFTSRESCQSFLEEAGYTDAEITTKQMGYHLASEQDWWEIVWNSGLRGIVDLLTPGQLAEFRLKHLDRVAGLKTENGIWMDVEVLFSQGNK